MFFRLALMGLAVWRLTRLIRREDGPKCIIRKFREVVGIRPGVKIEDGSLQDLIMCPKCLSIWLALGFMTAQVFAPQATEFVCWVLALSTIAIILTDWDER